MSRDRQNRTYRVQQVPAYLSLSEVAEFLVTASHRLGPVTNIVVWSLAPSLGFTSYITHATKTATITFEHTPSVFDNDEEQWSVPSDHDRWSRNLVFDTHFRGFTALNEVRVAEQQLDCIAISGLASHPFGSWKQRASGSNFMWLRDQLPMDLPFVRPIIYGYDTRLLKSQSFKSISDLALGLTEDLRTIRQSISGNIIFLAHSLGGIVLKQAVVTLANSGVGEDQLLSKVRMICFFGVPNQGMHNQHLLAMVEGQPNQELVESLSSDAGYLPELDIRFTGLAVFRSIRFVSIYETKESLTTKEVEPGVWIRSMPYRVLVQKSSAIQRGTLQADTIPVDEDHSNMVKFAENDEAYKRLCKRIEQVRYLRPTAYDVQRDTLAPSKAAAYRESDLEFKWPLTLVESLNLAETSKRQAEIERAYKSTFDWVYENPELNLITWLRGDGPIFWIRGKPGSGKSTLMKYLHDSEETSTCTTAWDTQTRVVCCWFFFYARGSSIQKSFEGLLHSILHQLMQEEPRLSALVLPFYLERSRAEVLRGAFASQRFVWSFEDLKSALDIILRQKVFNLRLFLFLDALDEYGGRPQLIADFLKSIATPHENALTKVKICFSSRPWSVFVNNFDSYPGFSIHEFTKRDIWTYTESRLATQYPTQLGPENPYDSDIVDSPETKPKQSISSQIAQVTLAVVEKAHGVFLWVRLVLNEFLKSAIDGASLNDLHEFLSTMPEELEEFYDMILQRIPKNYLLESYNMIEILLRSGQELRLAEFGSALACSSCKTIEESLSHPQFQLGGKLNRSYYHNMKLKIESRCGGLVEILGTEARTARVQFMHQTAKEFANKPDFKQRILGNFGMSAGRNGHSILAKYYLSAATLDQPPADCLSLAMFHAWHSESMTGLSQATFLNSITESAFGSLAARHLVHSQYVPHTVLALAVTADLRLYVTEELERRPLLLKMQPKMSLVHAVVRHTMLNQEPSSFPRINPIGSLGPMCGILLKLGDSINSEYEQETPFEWLFGQHWRMILSRGNTNIASQAMFDVVESLLNAGQSPDNDIFISPVKKDESCKPLHLARSRFTALLLQHGASVNALDSLGRTALDLCIARAIKSLAARNYHNERRRKADEAFETAMLLIESGGHITTYGVSRLEDFLSVLEKFHSIPKEFKNIPLLPPLKPVGHSRSSHHQKQNSGRLGWISKAFKQGHS